MPTSFECAPIREPTQEDLEAADHFVRALESTATAVIRAAREDPNLIVSMRRRRIARIDGFGVFAQVRAGTIHEIANGNETLDWGWDTVANSKEVGELIQILRGRTAGFTPPDDFPLAVDVAALLVNRAIINDYTRRPLSDFLSQERARYLEALRIPAGQLVASAPIENLEVKDADFVPLSPTLRLRRLHALSDKDSARPYLQSGSGFANVSLRVPATSRCGLSVPISRLQD